jgi:hypothetical protein
LSTALARSTLMSGAHVLVEVVLADQQLVHDLEELAGAGTLDDAVVVGAGERDGLRYGQAGERLDACALELGRVIEGARADDAALALHQARHGVHGSDAARVGERHGRAGEIVGRELALAGTADEVFVR